MGYLKLFSPDETCDSGSSRCTRQRQVRCPILATDAITCCSCYTRHPTPATRICPRSLEWHVPPSSLQFPLSEFSSFLLSSSAFLLRVRIPLILQPHTPFLPEYPPSLSTLRQSRYNVTFPCTFAHLLSGLSSVLLRTFQFSFIFIKIITSGRYLHTPSCCDYPVTRQRYDTRRDNIVPLPVRYTSTYQLEAAQSKLYSIVA